MNGGAPPYLGNTLAPAQLHYPSAQHHQQQHVYATTGQTLNQLQSGPGELIINQNQHQPAPPPSCNGRRQSNPPLSMLSMLPNASSATIHFEHDGGDYDLDQQAALGNRSRSGSSGIPSCGTANNNAFAVHPLGADISNSELTHDIRSKPRTYSQSNLNQNTGGRWYGKGESLTTEAAVQIMVNERQRMEEEYAQLRIENQALKSELNRNSRIIAPPNQSMNQSQGYQHQHQHQQQQQQYKAGGYQQQNFATPPAKTQPPAAIAGNTNRFMPETPPPVLVPEKIWRGGSLWRIPFNGKGAPEIRHVCIKRAVSISQQSSSAMLFLGSTLGHIRQASITDSMGNGTLQDPMGDIPTVVFPISLMWLSVKDPTAAMNLLSNPSSDDGSNSNEDLSSARELVLYQDSYLVVGHKTPAFAKMLAKNNPVPPPQLCFSIVTSSRSLDLAADDEESANEWIQVLTVLLSQKSYSNMLNTPGMRPPSHFNNEKFYLTLGLGSPIDPAAQKMSMLNSSSNNSNSNSNSSNNGNAGLISESHNLPSNSNSSNAPPPPPPGFLYSNPNNLTLPVPIPVINLQGQQGQQGSSYNGAVMPPAPPSNPSAISQTDAWKLSREQYLRKKQEDMTRAMFDSALIGDVDGLENSLRFGIPVNAMDPSTSDTPLLIACKRGFVKIVEKCLEYGAKNDPHPEFGQTALHIAVQEGHIDIVRTILSTAAESESDSMICNLADPRGRLPLQIAAEKGFEALVELLISHGSEIEHVDENEQTVLHLVCANGHKLCLASLLDHGGDDIIDISDALGNTPLHLAALYGHLSCVRLLCETAATVLATNKGGQTPHMLASSRGHHQIVLLLQDYSPAMNSVSNSSNNNARRRGPIANTNGRPSHLFMPHNAAVNQSYPPPPRGNVTGLGSGGQGVIFHGQGGTINNGHGQSHSHSSLKITTDDIDRDRIVRSLLPHAHTMPHQHQLPPPGHELSPMLRRSQSEGNDRTNSLQSTSSLPRPFSVKQDSVTSPSFVRSSDSSPTPPNNNHLLRNAMSTPDKLHGMSGLASGDLSHNNNSYNQYNSPGVHHNYHQHHLGGSMSARDSRDRTFSHNDAYPNPSLFPSGNSFTSQRGSAKDAPSSSLSPNYWRGDVSGPGLGLRVDPSDRGSSGSNIDERPRVYSPLSARERERPSLINPALSRNDPYSNNTNVFPPPLPLPLYNSNNSSEGGRGGDLSPNQKPVEEMQARYSPLGPNYSSNSSSSSSSSNGSNVHLTPNSKLHTNPPVPFYAGATHVYNTLPVPANNPNPYANSNYTVPLATMSPLSPLMNPASSSSYSQASSSGGSNDNLAALALAMGGSPSPHPSPLGTGGIGMGSVSPANPSNINLPRPGRAAAASSSSTSSVSAPINSTAPTYANVASINSIRANSPDITLAVPSPAYLSATSSADNRLTSSSPPDSNPYFSGNESKESDNSPQPSSYDNASVDAAIFDGYLEKFMSHDVTWYSYSDDASGCVYFLDSSYKYSTQWEDPREYGITSEAAADIDDSRGDTNIYCSTSGLGRAESLSSSVDSVEKALSSMGIGSAEVRSHAVTSTATSSTPLHNSNRFGDEHSSPTVDMTQQLGGINDYYGVVTSDDTTQSQCQPQADVIASGEANSPINVKLFSDNAASVGYAEMNDVNMQSSFNSNDSSTLTGNGSTSIAPSPPPPPMFAGNVYYGSMSGSGNAIAGYRASSESNSDNNSCPSNLYDL